MPGAESLDEGRTPGGCQEKVKVEWEALGASRMGKGAGPRARRAVRTQGEPQGPKDKGGGSTQLEAVRQEDVCRPPNGAGILRSCPAVAPAPPQPGEPA